MRKANSDSVIVTVSFKDPVTGKRKIEGYEVVPTTQSFSITNFIDEAVGQIKKRLKL
jgi:hypothetical protein